MIQSSQARFCDDAGRPQNGNVAPPLELNGAFCSLTAEERSTCPAYAFAARQIISERRTRQIHQLMPKSPTLLSDRDESRALSVQHVPHICENWKRERSPTLLVGVMLIPRRNPKTLASIPRSVLVAIGKTTHLKCCKVKGHGAFHSERTCRRRAFLKK